MSEGQVIIVILENLVDETKSNMNKIFKIKNFLIALLVFLFMPSIVSADGMGGMVAGAIVLGVDFVFLILYFFVAFLFLKKIEKASFKLDILFATISAFFIILLNFLIPPLNMMEGASSNTYELLSALSPLLVSLISFFIIPPLIIFTIIFGLIALFIYFSKNDIKIPFHAFLIVFLTAIFLFNYSYVIQPIFISSNNCGFIADSNIRSECYANLAIKTGQEKYCYKSSYRCFQVLAKNLNNPALCEKISLDNRLNEEQKYYKQLECYLNGIPPETAEKQIDFCNRIIDSKFKDRCFREIDHEIGYRCQQNELNDEVCAKYLSTGEKCLQSFTYGGGQDFCLFNSAIIKDDPSMCLGIKGDSDKERCILRMANTIEDADIACSGFQYYQKFGCYRKIYHKLSQSNYGKICEQIIGDGKVAGANREGDECYSFFAVHPDVKDKSLCDKINNLEIKATCYQKFNLMLMEQ